MDCPVYAKRQDTIKFAYDNNISIPEAIRACNEKIPQNPKSPHASSQQLTEIDSLKKEVERLRESLEQFQVKTTEELKSLSAKAEATDVEISTIKSQVIPLISLPTIVEDIKTNTEEGFKSTIEKLNLLFELFKNNNDDGPLQKKTPNQPNISQLRNTRPSTPSK
jgi:predicted RNase H-like nuclease (RuvC/YqgF family)